MINKIANILVAIYIYLGLVGTIKYFMGHSPVLPSGIDKEYPVLEGIPGVSQESIDKAIKNFEIKVPLFALYPRLDEQMFHANGQAYLMSLFHICKPTIGPGAFSSWGKLASTIAHEVEVHCNQNLWRAQIDELTGNSVVSKLEREAYMYTILDAKRFQLTENEIMTLTLTMETYYPAGDQDGQGSSTEEAEERTISTTEGE